MAKDGCHGIFFGFTGNLIMFTELYTVPMKKLLTVVTALTAALYSSAAKSDELKSVLNDLDTYIENSDIYVQQKQERIDHLQQKLLGGHPAARHTKSIMDFLKNISLSDMILRISMPTVPSN